FVVECKAYHKKKSIPGNEVTKFFTETLPALKKKLREQGRQFTRCSAQIWTTGSLGNDARDTLYDLACPKTDEWTMIPGKDLPTLLPKVIRKRAAELLDAIALEESD